ncbi:MAG: hypothetical protein JSU01_22745 [Bacteroidetes bacterium]|nr:hypothetical protein [Bacteroidota bacterium]
MKRLMYIASVFLMSLIAISFTAIKINTHPKHQINPVQGYTLNNIPIASADAMIGYFQQNRGVYDNTKPTSIWFSEAELNGMLSVMGKYADGIRFYFGKTTPDGQGQYVIIPISTVDVGPDPKDATGKRHIHSDYYQYQLIYTTDQTPVPVAGRMRYDNDSGGAAFYTTVINPCTTPGTCVSQNDHYIDCNTALTMVRHYGSDQINANSEWFDRGIIKQLADSIKSKKGSGLRIYFARQINPDGSQNPDTIHRHGFVMIPTSVNGSVNKDYYDCFTLQPIYKIVNPKGGGGGTDNGEECPTNCSGGTLP